DNGTGNGNALFLPSGQGNAAFPEHGVIALAEACDVLVYGSIPRGLVDLLLGGIGLSELDVVPDGIAEQESILRNITYGLPQGRQVHAADIFSIDQDLALLHVIKPSDEVEDGGFSRAR